ncbi:hypothetical protein QR46_0788 [Giardia duodenalis assemblage B]|uniref:Uncharacterized protein n=1 Tax=Giardia duodenalis assemblage B TaxID=1394984 RepID=A0A132NYL3_GIAIN|nr:hypothetical protein QR46_0788 [Giardia intestinalis assemblage B]
MKVPNLCKASIAGTKIRIRQDVRENLDSEISCSKWADDLIRKPEVVHSFSSNNIGSGKTAGDKILGSLCKSALADVHHLRYLEPQRIAPHDSDLLVVQKMLWSHILRDRVLAVRAATDSHSRIECEVVEVANTSKRAGRVDNDAASINVVREVVDAITSVRRSVDGRRVTCSGHIDHLPADIDGLLKGIRPADSQNRRKLLAGHRLAMAHFGEGTNDAAALAVCRNGNTGSLRDYPCRTADYIGIELVLPSGLVYRHDQFVNELLLTLRHNVSTAELELLDTLVVDLLCDANNGLLGSTNNAVIK